MKNHIIAVIIPCYKVACHIMDVLAGIGDEVARIYVVDDGCPESTGKLVQSQTNDPRIRVLFHEKNKGVGAAMVTGYQQAIDDGATILVKLDGDGQMLPHYIEKLIAPIVKGKADYTKGNRFFNIEKLLIMPRLRLIGNSLLSLINKNVNGYWDIIDPTNGFTAIHIEAIGLLPLHKLDNRFFFESDMLFRLSTIRAVVKDVPIPAVYGNEKSNMKISRILMEFPFKYLNRFFKRMFYSYFLREFNTGTIQMLIGSLAMLSGLIYGIYHWAESARAMVVTPTGTVMISTVLVILGFQLLLGALNFDIQNIPKDPIQKL